VTVLGVLSLSAVAEKVSPRLAGVLAGYPVGSAISLGFYGVEFGADFAGRCASHNLAGLVASPLSYLSTSSFPGGRAAFPLPPPSSPCACCAQDFCRAGSRPPPGRASVALLPGAQADEDGCPLFRWTIRAITG